MMLFLLSLPYKTHYCYVFIVVLHLEQIILLYIYFSLFLGRMANIDNGLEFPQELCVIPQSLVGVAGLDTLNNAVHRIIWEALINSRRQDRSPVHFKLLGPVHEFPTGKPKVCK